MTTTFATPLAPATEKQVAFIKKLISEKDGRLVSEDQDILEVYKSLVYLPELSKKGASTAIDNLLNKENWHFKNVNAASKIEPAVPAVPIGTYTVVLDGDDDYVTLQIAPAKWAGGKIAASYLHGPDNECSYKGFAFVNGDKVNVWKSFTGSDRIVTALQLLITGDVDKAHEEFLNRAEAFALASGRCMRCGRTLTVPASLHRGLGPVCAGIEGI